MPVIAKNEVEVSEDVQKWKHMHSHRKSAHLNETIIKMAEDPTSGI